MAAVLLNGYRDIEKLEYRGEIEMSMSETGEILICADTAMNADMVLFNFR